MINDYFDKECTFERAKIKLEKAKEEESRTTLHMRQISPTTVVYCKRKERLDDYDRLYNKKITLDSYGR